VITNCSSDNGIVTGGTQVGGLVGAVYVYGVLSDSYSNMFVSGNTLIGGLVGFCTRQFSALGTIHYCYSLGNVQGLADVGGLVGVNAGLIMSSYATGNVEGNDSTGGLVGAHYNDEGIISSSYASGSVDGGIYTGGLVGIINSTSHPKNLKRMTMHPNWISAKKLCKWYGGFNSQVQLS